MLISKKTAVWKKKMILNRKEEASSMERQKRQMKQKTGTMTRQKTKSACQRSTKYMQDYSEGVCRMILKMRTGMMMRSSHR